MITDAMIESALKAFNKPAYLDRDKVRAALEAVEGAIQQQHDNEQVRWGKQQGRCPTCGADME